MPDFFRPDGSALALPYGYVANPTGVAFTEDWYSRSQQRALAELAHETDAALPRAALFLEVGCWEGRSTIALAKAIEPRTLHAIDHFAGDDDNPHGGGVTPQLAQSRDVMGRFLSNVAAAGCTNVELHAYRWQRFFERIAQDQPTPVSIGFCHIDGAHDYESVYRNIEAVLHFAVPGTVLCGDDVLQSDVKRAILKAAERFSLRPHISEDATCMNFWWMRVGE